MGGLIEPGNVLTERQRQTLYQLGLEVAALLSQAGEARNTFAIVFGGVKKRFEGSDLQTRVFIEPEIKGLDEPSLIDVRLLKPPWWRAQVMRVR